MAQTIDRKQNIEQIEKQPDFQKDNIFNVCFMLVELFLDWKLIQSNFCYVHYKIFSLLISGHSVPNF